MDKGPLVPNRPDHSPPLWGRATLVRAMKANTVLLLSMFVSVAGAADANIERQSRDDAWWTGPLLAASPVTLPPGHFLIEPYLFDAIPRGHYDDEGTRHSGPHANNFGSQSYVLYGLVDGLTVG